MNKIDNLGKYAQKGNIPWNKGLGKKEVMCLYCNDKFKVTPNRVETTKYCSLKCHGIIYKQILQNKRPKIICQECNSIFYVQPSKKGTAKYCSASCRVKAVSRSLIGIPLSVEHKKKMSDIQRGKLKLNLRGENHWNWQGGVTGPNKLERERFRNIMQHLIFERDNYKCQICDSTKDLQVDHIASWSEFKELRFDPENCRTLCAKCHYKMKY